MVVSLLFVLSYGFQGSQSKLGEDAADAPHVRGLVVLALDQRNLWRTVPSGANMARKRALLVSKSLVLNYKLLGDRFIDQALLLGCFTIMFADVLSDSTSVSRALSYKALWKRSRYSIITNLDLTVLVDQDIGRFQVSVHHVGGMHELDGAEEVVAYEFDVGLRHSGYMPL